MNTKVAYFDSSLMHTFQLQIQQLAHRQLDLSNPVLHLLLGLAGFASSKSGVLLDLIQLSDHREGTVAIDFQVNNLLAIWKVYLSSKHLKSVLIGKYFFRKDEPLNVLKIKKCGH